MTDPLGDHVVSGAPAAVTESDTLTSGRSCSTTHPIGPAPVGYWGLTLGTAIGVPLVAEEPLIRAAVFGLFWPSTLLEPADVLLAKARDLGEFLLGQTFLLPDPLEVAPDKPAHVHAPNESVIIWMARCCGP